MVKVLEEPVHPQVREEADQRVSLVQAIEKEIEYLKTLEEKQTNKMWAQVVAVQRNSLNRILKDWIQESTD